LNPDAVLGALPHVVNDGGGGGNEFDAEDMLKLKTIFLVGLCT
jgi:hypothetical protein